MSKLLSWSGHKFIALPARFYIGFVFILASLHKIAHPGSFALDIATYDILPLALVNLQAIMLPWLEILTGVMLIIGYKTRANALIISGMMIMFIVAISMAIAKGIDTSCGCFASATVANEDPISTMTIIRDLAWFMIAMYIVIFDTKPIGIDVWLLRGKTNHE